MKKLFKRVISAVMAAAVTISLTISAGAVNEALGSNITGSSDMLETYLNETLPNRLLSLQTDSEIKTEISNYISQTLPFYLSINQLYGSYKTSDLIPLHNWDGEDMFKYISVIMDDNKMIGTLTAEFTGEKIISVFRTEMIPEINNAIVNKIPFQLGYSNNCFLIYINGEFSVLDNRYAQDVTFTSTLSANPAMQCTAELSGEAVTAKSTRSSYYQTSPAVKAVSNAISPDTGDGLCWAACVASIGMHYNSTAYQQNLTALDIYNRCKNITSSDRPAGFPEGSKTWVQVAHKYLFGIITTRTGALSASRVTSLLKANKPIYCSMDNTTNPDLGHAIVLWNHTYKSSTSGAYVFMDPGNVGNGGMLSVIIDGDIMKDGSGLALTSRNGNYYDKWDASFYKT